MPQTFKIKSSTVEGKAPVAGDLATAELALNLKDQKLYSKDADGNVFEIGQAPEVDGFVKLNDEGTEQDIIGGGGLDIKGPVQVFTGVGQTGTRIGTLQDGTDAVGYLETNRSVTGADAVAQFAGMDGAVTFMGDGSGTFAGGVDAIGAVGSTESVTAGGMSGGYLTGVVADKSGNVTIINRSSGNLIDATYSFSGTTKNFVVDQDANLTIDGAITAVFGTNALQRGNVAPLNDWSCYPERA